MNETVERRNGISKRFQWTVIYNRLPGTMDITEPGQKWMGQDLALECRFYELD